MFSCHLIIVDFKIQLNIADVEYVVYGLLIMYSVSHHAPVGLYITLCKYSNIYDYYPWI